MSVVGSVTMSQGGDIDWSTIRIYSTVSIFVYYYFEGLGYLLLRFWTRVLLMRAIAILSQFSKISNLVLLLSITLRVLWLKNPTLRKQA